MAALSSDVPLPIVDLCHVDAALLRPLLREESGEWERRLDWDFSPAAVLVERYVGMRTLSGFALMAGGEVVGYLYYAVEERKGLIGDLYVRRAFRTEDNENRLLARALEYLASTPWVRRVESQLLMLSSSLGRRLPMSARAREFPRTFMEIELDQPAGTCAEPAGLVYQPWNARYQEDAARLIASAYRGHIDAEINDQYRSAAGARRFLNNIVQYPGCGTFSPPASLVALAPNGEVRGVCLASIVRTGVGHITQLCVGPEARRRSLGQGMLRHSLERLRLQGCRKVTLTVTSSNSGAIALYARMGFQPRLHFGAFVWDNL